MLAKLSMAIVTVLLAYHEYMRMHVHVGGSPESYIELFPEKIPNRLENIRIIPPENRQFTQRNSRGNGYALNTTEGIIANNIIGKLLRGPFVPVVGSTSSNVYYDHNWGLFSSILASYNNHWPLRTSPDDWWTVVLRVVAQAMANHGDVQAVRDIFVEHQGQKKLFIKVKRLSGIDYSWLFEQFSGAIRRNIKEPGYVDVIENDFSTTTVNTKIVSQVMLMSSLQKYFSYGFGTDCGIPRIYMKGTAEDWEKLVKKLQALDQLLDPVKKELRLRLWFDQAREVFQNLQQTFSGNPDIRWWGRILSWREVNMSGWQSHWEGWFPAFLGATTDQPASADDFPSGLVEVPVEVNDYDYVEKGKLLAGTLGFTVTENDQGVPVVEPNQVWSLLLPQGSILANQLRGV